MKTLFTRFRISKGHIIVFGIFEAVIPFTLLFFLIIRISQRYVDLSQDTAVAVNILKVRSCWVVLIIVSIIYLLFGIFRKTLLSIDKNGIAFSKDKFFYEYEWDEIKFIVEQYNDFAPTLYIYTMDKKEPYIINLDGYMWTLLPVRWACHHFAKGKVTYYTKKQWKKLNNPNP